MFDTLGNKLQDLIRSISGNKQITADNIESAIAKVRLVLLESDVSLKAVKLFITRVRNKALGSEVIKGVRPDEQFVKIIYNALVEILGGESTELNFKRGDSILLLGLQGAGKTTAAAKLALKLKKEGQKPLLVPCDLQRPAAIKQLQILAEQADVNFFQVDSTKALIELVKQSKEYAKENNIDVLIYDTAGRLQVDTNLMAELFLLEKAINPVEKLLVIDSLIGQEAANVAETFDTQIGVTGVILTKLDSDTKGGAALSVVEAIQKPIKLASVGEKLEELEVFYPDRVASRILGMGDILSLVEKAEEKIKKEEAEKLEEQLMKGDFNYETFLAAQNMMGQLGSFSSVFKMMGMGSVMNKFGLDSESQESLLEEGQAKSQKYKVIINSMTVEERRKANLLSTGASSKSRKSRIAKGSGLQLSDVDRLVAEFNKMKQLFSKMAPLLNTSNPLGALSSGMNMNFLAGKKNTEEKRIKKGSQPQIKGFRN